MFLAEVSLNQRFPSGPVTILFRPAASVGAGNSVIDPLVVIRPMLFPCCSVNQRFPSGPAAIPRGEALLLGKAQCVNEPVEVLSVPILLAWFSVK